MNKEKLSGIIKTFHVSEKSTFVGNLRQYVFKTAKEATKPEIKQAIELFLNVKVEAIRVSNIKPKSKRTGRIIGRRSGWKKAYVKLKEGYKIDFSGMTA